MIIIENAFPDHIFNFLRQTIFDIEFQWHFIPFTGYGDQRSLNDSKNYYLTHICYDGNKVSPLYESIKEGFEIALLKTDIKLNSIKRIRINLFPNVGEHIVHDPHVDTKESHKIALLYMNDSVDGDTYLYNESYDPSYNLTVPKYKEEILKNNFCIAKRISSKENRLLICDGYRYHASSTPTDTKGRVAINFNFTTID